MVAALRDNFYGLTLSIAVHGVLLFALLHSVQFAADNRPVIQASVIEAVVIDEGRRKAELAARVAQQRRAEQQRREAEARRRREAARKAAAAKAAEEKVAAQKAAAEKAAAEKAAAEKAAADKAASEKSAAEKAASEKIANEKAAAEQRAARQKALADQLNSEEFARREADERAQRLAAQKARQDALASELAVEQAARESSEIDVLLAQYSAIIAARVQRNWIRPPGFDESIRCEVGVNQLPDGQITDVKLIGTCGNTLLDASVEKAVYRSAPFPLAPDPRIQRLAREIQFVFTAGN